MNPIDLPAAVEPVEWTVVFHREASSWWFSLIALGRFKHVSAFAYLPGLRGWVIHDWQFGGLRVAVLPHSDEACRLIRAMFGPTTEWVQVTRRPGPSSWSGLRFGSCVGAVKHLLGIRCDALRPDALYRHLMAWDQLKQPEPVREPSPAPPPDQCSARLEPVSAPLSVA